MSETPTGRENSWMAKMKSVEGKNVSEGGCECVNYSISMSYEGDCGGGLDEFVRLQ